MRITLERVRPSHYWRVRAELPNGVVELDCYGSLGVVLAALRVYVETIGG